MVDRRWGSAPLHLEHTSSEGSSLARDTPTVELLGGGSDLLRSSSGWGDDDTPLPDPRNRTPITPRAVSGPAALHQQPQRQHSQPAAQPHQVSWHERHLAQQREQAARAAQQEQRSQSNPHLESQLSWSQRQYQQAAARELSGQQQQQPAQSSLQHQNSWHQQHLARQQATAAAREAQRRALPPHPLSQQDSSPFTSQRRPSHPPSQEAPPAGQLQRHTQSWQPSADEAAEARSNAERRASAPEAADLRQWHQPIADATATLRTESSAAESAAPSNASWRVRHTSDRGDCAENGISRTTGNRGSGSYHGSEMDQDMYTGGTSKTSSLPGLLGNALGLRLPSWGGPQYVSPPDKPNRQTFKWNQNPFVSFRDVWQSLPRVARVLLVWVLIEAVLIVVYAATILATNTSQQFVFPLLITGVFLTYMTWDSVLLENTTQLFASMLLALVISAARIVANSVGRETLSFKGQALGWFILIMHGLTIVLALLTWRDFGWRLHSRLGVDFRRKGAGERRRLHSAQAVFVTLVKFDVMWEICLTAVAVALAKAHSSNQLQAEKMLAINLTGLGANLIIGWGAWTVVRHRTFRTLWPIVDVLMPISFLQPILTFALVWSNGWEKWNAAYWDSLVVSAPLLMASRAAVWACMHYILWRIRRLEAIAGEDDDDADLLRHNAHLHEELLPLLRGAWLGKPSQASPRKRCFFQLSADGSTLRWSWHKFVRLYYVDEIVCNDTALTINITMTVDRDLMLVFPDRKSFQAWTVGLERALSMLMGPGGAGPDTPLYGAGGSGSIIRTESGGMGPTPSRAGRSRLLQTLGIRFTKTGAGSSGGTARARTGSNTGQTPPWKDAPDGKQSPKDSRWTFWNRSTADGGTPLSPRSEARVDRLQRVRRVQMAHYLDALRRAVAPMPPSVAPPAFPQPAATDAPVTPRTTSVARLNEASCIEEAADLEYSAARTRRPGAGSRAASPRKVPQEDASAGSPPKDGYKGPVRRPELETPSMVWARIQRASPSGPAQPGSPAAASGGSKLANSSSSVWAQIMAGKASAEGQANVAPAGGPLAATPVPESRPLAPDEAPLGRSLTDMWALLQSGKPVVQEVVPEHEEVRPPPIDTSPQLSGPLDGALDAAGTTPITPGPSPTVDSVLHSIWVDIIDVDELKFGRRLGAGAQGEVYAAWWRGKPVAVKKFARAADAVHEVQMHLCAGQHPNVVELKALCQHDLALYLVMAFFPRGTMEVMLHHTAAKRWDTAKLLLIIRSIANGLHYLHTRSPPVLHRDIKPGNLFVGVNQTIKIGDFGMSRFVGADSVATSLGPRPLQRNLTVDIIGTAHYASPEMLNDELLEGFPEDASGSRHLKIDVFAFGVTLWEMLMRQRPHGDLHPFQIQGMVLLNPEDLVLPAVRIPEDMPAAERAVIRSLADLVVQCTSFSPDDRPSAAEILQILDDIWSDFERVGQGGRPPLGEISPARGAGGSSGIAPSPPRGAVAQLLRGHSRKHSAARLADLDSVAELSGRGSRPGSYSHSRAGSFSAAPAAR